MSFRQITNAGRRRINIGKYPSVKMGTNIWIESILERDLIHHLEYDPNVTSYRAQSVRIFFELEGKRRHYTPDVVCERRIGRPQIIEVKPQKNFLPGFSSFTESSLRSVSEKGLSSLFTQKSR